MRFLALALLLLCGTGCIGDNLVNARGVVLNPAGQPVPGADVILLKGGYTDRQLTEEAGLFSIARVSAPYTSRFRMSVTADGYKEVNGKLHSNQINHLVVVLVPSGSAGESSIAPWPEPCSEPWLKIVETVLPSGDGMGHGPDIGSDEWKSVMEFKLGVRGNADVPDRSTPAWCDYMDRQLLLEGRTKP